MAQVTAARKLERSPAVSEGFVPGGDGTALYFRAQGEGPALVLCNGLGVSTFFWRHLVEAFAGDYRVVIWDYPSHGRSSKASDALSIRSLTGDLFRVMDHLGIRQAVLAGHSLGSQVILEAYRQAPERVLALVPTLGGYGRTVETFFNSRLSLPALRALRKVAMVRPSVSQRVLKMSVGLPGALTLAGRFGLVHPELCPPEEMQPYLEHLGRLDLSAYFQLAQDLQDHDAFDLLPQVEVPTLVFGAERDLFTPLHVSERMAAAIPGAELCVFPAGSHAALIEQPQLMCLRLERFLVGRLGMPRMGRLPVR